MNHNKIPAFLTGNGKEDKERLKLRFYDWIGDTVIVPLFIKWLEKKIEDLIKKDEKLLGAEEFGLTKELIQNHTRRATYREILDIFKPED